MKIKVNSDAFDFPEGKQLDELMKKLFIQEKKGIAVAVNAEVIPKKMWIQCELKENDEVIIIEATQGG